MPAKPLPGPSRLSQILKNLNREPKPLLTGLKAINLSCATKNEHFGAREVEIAQFLTTRTSASLSSNSGEIYIRGLMEVHDYAVY